MLHLNENYSNSTKVAVLSTSSHETGITFTALLELIIIKLLPIRVHFKRKMLEMNLAYFSDLLVINS